MRTICNVLLVGILLVCQQYVSAQDYRLGRKKAGFNYESLYSISTDAPKTVVVEEKQTTTPAPKPTTQIVAKEQSQPTAKVKPVTQPTAKPAAPAQPVVKTVSAAPNEPVWANDPNAPKASTNEIQRYERAHQQLNQLCDQTIYDDMVYDVYLRLNKSFPKTSENVQTMMKIQMVVLMYYSTKTATPPDLAKRIRGASSLVEQKKILLSYAK